MWLYRQMNVRGITVNSLRGMTNSDIIKTIINDQIRLIDAKILSAHEGGFSKIEYELPTNFAVNGLEKADIQLIVYSDLVKIYGTSVKDGGKGFTVRVETGVISKLHIGWPNTMQGNERDERRRILIQHGISKGGR
jgi:hypothetical protein